MTSSEATNVLDSTIASLLVTVVDDSSSTSEEYDSELEDSSSDSCQGKDEDEDEEEGTGENWGRGVVVEAHISSGTLVVDESGKNAILLLVVVEIVGIDLGRSDKSAVPGKNFPPLREPTGFVT